MCTPIPMCVKAPMKNSPWIHWNMSKPFAFPDRQWLHLEEHRWGWGTDSPWVPPTWGFVSSGRPWHRLLQSRWAQTASLRTAGYRVRRWLTLAISSLPSWPWMKSVTTKLFSPKRSNNGTVPLGLYPGKWFTKATRGNCLSFVSLSSHARAPVRSGSASRPGWDRHGTLHHSAALVKAHQELPRTQSSHKDERVLHHKK